MASKRVLVVSAALTGLLLVTLWKPGSARQLPRVVRPARIDDAGIASLRELVQQQATAYRAGQLPSPSLHAKGLLSEKNAGTGKEPGFNQVSQSTNGPTHSGSTPASTGKTNNSGQNTGSSGATTKDAPQPGNFANHPGLTPGYHPTVNVLAPGRLDWTYVASDETLDPDAIAATAGYVSTRQSYEFYAPPARVPIRPYPLILSVATGPRSTAWGYFQQTCQKHGVLFAGVHGAGNDVSMARRARTVLDVLDDVRRRFPVDPDRTYIVGVSGGGHAAASIAHALPELFGGAMCICGAWNLRLEPTCRLRVAERLSEAVMTGATDFNRPELEREFFPILRHENVRSQLWVYPGMGHGCPGPAQLEQVFQWLEAGLPQRRLAGAVFPASRLLGTPSPADWSNAMLEEAGQRLSMPGGEESGLFLLQGVVNRWKTLPAARVARALLSEFDKVSPVPWNDINRAERLRFRYLQAKTFDGIVNSPSPPNYPVPHSNLVGIAISLWQEIRGLATPGSAAAKEADARLTSLQKALGR